MNHAAASTFIVMDNDENPWGPFDARSAAQTWAEKKWPGLEWHEDGAKGGYWEIVALRSPEEDPTTSRASHYS